MAERPDSSAPLDGQAKLRAVVFLLVCVLFLAAAGILWGADRLKEVDDEIALPLLIIAGVIVVGITSALVIGLLSLLGVATPRFEVSAVSRFGWLILLAGAFSVAMVATVVLAANTLKQQDLFRPEIVLPLLLITGLIALVIALAILVGAFHLFKLTSPDKPFGVPEGTLQAVIALTIILIFAVTSLYLRGSLDPQHITIERLSLTQRDALLEDVPAVQILGVRQSEGADGKPIDGLFDVDRLVPTEQDAKDFSNQLLTILGTLVGAIAGFYFGAKSVETGVSAGTSGVQPTNTSPPTIGGRPHVGESLRAEPGGWTGSPPPAYAYQWQRKPRRESDWVDIRDAADPSYVVSVDDTDAEVRVVVVATNASGKATAPSPATGPVTRTPTNHEPPSISPMSPELGKELTTKEGTWTASPELGPSPYSYQWERADPPAGEFTPIPGANQKAYTPGANDVGKRIRVRVTATNNAGSGDAVSQQTDIVAEPPSSAEPPAITGRPVFGEHLTATPGAWTGTPQPALAYQWERSPDEANWTPIDGADSTIYTLTAEDVGKRVRARVTASNDAGTAEAISQPSSVVAEEPADEEQGQARGEQANT